MFEIYRNKDIVVAFRPETYDHDNKKGKFYVVHEFGNGYRAQDVLRMPDGHYSFDTFVPANATLARIDKAFRFVDENKENFRSMCEAVQDSFPMDTVYNGSGRSDYFSLEEFEVWLPYGFMAGIWYFAGYTIIAVRSINSRYNWTIEKIVERKV